jgi:hypothetical protein
LISLRRQKRRNKEVVVRKVFIVLLALCFVVVAKQRTELTKVVKTDTTVVAPFDSTVLVREDTLKITTTFQDTSLVIKRDTVKAFSAPRIVQKPLKK